MVSSICLVEHKYKHIYVDFMCILDTSDKSYDLKKKSNSTKIAEFLTHV